MPPSHHSSSHHSSSHHSSHHSSSHHSSSHRSSSHHSSSSRGPSGHSTSTHRSYSSTPVRSRRNQPSGYSSSVHNYMPTSRYHCRKHDYVFFPVAWVDPATNISYEAGYYDEDGQRYDDVVFGKDGKYITEFHCDYCDSTLKVEWKEGEEPRCPNCGADMTIKSVITDEVVPSTSGSVGSNSTIIKVMIIVGVVLTTFMFVFGTIFTTLVAKMNSQRDNLDYEYRYSYGDDDNYDYDYNYDYDDYDYNYSGESNVDMFGEELYVSEIDRYCLWDDEYECYYDPDSDCYFWYNTLASGCWQYWYEGISSDYPESGWMEYDEPEQCWYIEVKSGDWVVLPSKYDDSNLWHIKE